MKFVQSTDDSNEVDLNLLTDTFYDLFSGGKLNEAMKELIKALRKRISERGAAWFPRMWAYNHDGLGNKQPKDPLTIYVDLSLEPDEYVGAPTFSFSLHEVWKDLYDGHRNPVEEAITDKKGAKIVRDISLALRNLADEMDASIKMQR